MYFSLNSRTCPLCKTLMQGHFFPHLSPLKIWTLIFHFNCCFPCQKDQRKKSHRWDSSLSLIKGSRRIVEEKLTYCLGCPSSLISSCCLPKISSEYWRKYQKATIMLPGKQLSFKDQINYFFGPCFSHFR